MSEAVPLIMAKVGCGAVKLQIKKERRLRVLVKSMID